MPLSTTKGLEMGKKKLSTKWCVALVMGGVLPFAGAVAARAEEPVALTAADDIVSAVADPKLQLLLGEVLQRNPKLARMAAESKAAEQRSPQVKALPQPTASLTWFLLPPQTRVGPQKAAVNLAQRIPWFGTLELEEQVALWNAAASRARLEAARLEVVTDARLDALELSFLDVESQLVGEERTTLEHYAELALARYASGVGLDQAVIRIQAEITRTESRLLGIRSRRASVIARLNALRDRPQTTTLVIEDLEDFPELVVPADELRRRALDFRPEMVETQARIEAATVDVDLADKAYNPQIVLGLNYGYVSRRDDEAGRLNPPEDNGQDILGLSGGVSIPLWRKSLDAGSEERIQMRLAAEERRREVAARIDGELGDLLHRIPLLTEQVELYDDVLIVQVRESLRSAESAYAAGTVGALDLLDAERVLFQVRVAAERARTDLGIAFAGLEGVIAGPLMAVGEGVER